MPSATDPPLDLLITDLQEPEHRLQAQSHRARDYLARVLEFHLLPSCDGLAGHHGLLISHDVFDEWLFQDVQAKGLGLYTYATHPQSGATELALVTAQV